MMETNFESVRQLGVGNAPAPVFYDQRTLDDMEQRAWVEGYADGVKNGAPYRSRVRWRAMRAALWLGVGAWAGYGVAKFFS